MDRVLQNTQADAKVTFYDANGVAVDATGTPTVTITRATGTALVTNAATTKVTGTTGVYKYPLSPTQTALLDFLTLAWTAVIGAASQIFTTHVEVVGGFLFTIADARATPPLESTTTYPTDKIVRTRTLVETALEDACGVAFVPRYALGTVDPPSGRTLVTPRWPLISLRSVESRSGSGWAAQTVTDYTASRSGIYSTAWPRSYEPASLRIGYEHGYPSPPPRVSRAALLLAKRWLIEGPVDDRTTSMATDDGTFTLLTPGLRGALFDIPEVEATIQEYGVRIPVA
jgi:hypothetical protein